MTATHVRVFYPADPLGIVPGGIDTFLRGLFKWAPPDLEFSLVGMTTDPQRRPQGCWTRCSIGLREFDFFPVVTVGNAGGRGRIPLSLRFSFGVQRYRGAISHGFDVFDFHRPEPSLLFTADQRPKNAYFHNDPETIRSSQSDNLWRRLPGIYESIERYTFEKFDSAWCVRDSGVQTLRQRYPAQASRINFIPTWVDADVFNGIDDQVRQNLRRELAKAHWLDLDSQWIISVGRLDTQKDPLLTLAAFARLRAEKRRVEWLVVGDGVLRSELEHAAVAAGLEECVHFLGLRSPAQIADLLRSADVYALSSAYEGMPMALLEALGCGLPAAVTDVGEVRRVLQHGVNGTIATARDEVAFAWALSRVLDNAGSWRGSPARAAVETYQPEKVLAVAYENYRRLGAAHARIRNAAETARSANSSRGANGLVVGLPVDVLERASASARITAWAKKNESRTVCFVNVHSAVHASLHESHRLTLLGADIVAPDGAPIAWTLRHKGYPDQQRVDGPGTMWRLCADAMAAGVKIGLYGSTPKTLQALVKQLKVSFPQLEVGYVHSPPFRTLTEDEDRMVCSEIAASGIGLLFVGLGCPKQELWMARHRGLVPAVMLGVGAAFEFHAGTASRAPEWLREHGLEWMHRLLTQPRRLWRRYLFSNTVFLGLSAVEALCSLAERLPLFRRLPPPLFSDGQLMTMNATLDVRAIEELVTRVDARLNGSGGRMIGFVASGSGEGTTTLAQGYASAVLARLQRRVLVLGVDKLGPGLPGVLPTLAKGLPLDECLQAFPGGGFCGSLGGGGPDEALWELLVRADLWADLRSRFDSIVLDLPATSVSRIGLVCATQCDGVVVVLEAEKTRAPVVENLINSLRAVGANMLGTVFNKRRYYLPQRIYRWL
jgi:exopolysaccharide biosynthesis WecB/TagA/CpsF family protein